ncbi:MAG: phage baseplate assembly protein V [Anaerolineae bacterium]|nr:phage baseplate assembly protein V [Anaerolineae bacterium]
MENDLFDPLFDEPDHHKRFYGVVIGVVTNNKDPEKLARIKVSFPWLSAESESNWARIAMPMTGSLMGTFFLPEVGDEVLVMFEHGMVEYPYIVGSLWNGVEKPPQTNEDGKNNFRLIKTRSGHQLMFDDTEGAENITVTSKSKHTVLMQDKSGEEKIEVKSKSGHIVRLDDKSGSEKVEVIDKSGNNSIVITSTDNTITVKANGKLVMEAQQDVTITSKTGKVSIEGIGVAINSKAELTIQATSTADIKSNAPMTLQSSAIMNVKGSLVNIN